MMVCVADPRPERTNGRIVEFLVAFTIGPCAFYQTRVQKNIVRCDILKLHTKAQIKAHKTRQSEEKKSLEQFLKDALQSLVGTPSP